MPDTIENNTGPTTLLSLEFGNAAPDAEEAYCREAMEVGAAGDQTESSGSEAGEGSLDSENERAFRNTVSVQTRARAEIVHLTSSKRRLSDGQAFFQEPRLSQVKEISENSGNTHHEGGAIS